MSDRLTPKLLLRAYAAGLFPMAEHQDDQEVFWVDPSRRGVFPLQDFRISRSLKRAALRGDYEARFDTAFEEVVRGCAERPETWINSQIFDVYAQLHQLGFAHSQEIWVDDELIGGVYGVTLGSAFFGESMFSRRRDASKIALAWLIDRLRLTGFTLFDTQFLTPHLESLGGVEIERQKYLAILEDSVDQSADITKLPFGQDASGVIQRNTQTS